MPVAIITGASKGLGRALAAELAGRGWDLVLNARSAEVLKQAALEIQAAAPDIRIETVPGDVADSWARGALVSAAEGLGGLDLLVNNASVLGAEPLVRLAETSVEGLRSALEINVVAPLGLIQQALPLLSAVPAGRVLNISSDAAAEAYETWGGYGASKAALDQLSAVLAVEHPELRVWWADPGDMATDLYAAAVPGDDLSDRSAPVEVAPVLLRLLDADAASGRYTASALRSSAVGS